MHKKNLLGAALLASAFITVAALADEPAVAPVEAQADAPRESGIQKLIADALDLVGIRYRRGGNDAETGFDCSGFVGYVFRERLGLELPRTSRDISRAGDPVEKSELAPGDLVFFNTDGTGASHVGIYIGDGQFVHPAASVQRVIVDRLDSPYYVARYLGARRVL